MGRGAGDPGDRRRRDPGHRRGDQLAHLLVGEWPEVPHYFLEAAEALAAFETTTNGHAGGGLLALDTGEGIARVGRFLRDAAELQVGTSWNLLFGFVGEQPSHYEQMARLNAKRSLAYSTAMSRARWAPPSCSKA